MENIFKDHIKHNSSIKILVVDDREDNLFSIETILDNNNYHIVKATSGRAALKILLGQHDFTLILMDVQMPDMNGFETANLIYQRDKLKHIPIIFITAHDQNDEHVFQGYKIGAVDYIYKPINPELLRFKVGVFAEMFRKNHQLLQQERNLLQMNAKLEQEIDERKLSEEKVRLLNQQLLENNDKLKSTIDELDRFAYVASHDLKEPLRKILFFSDKLISNKEKLGSSNVVDDLEKIRKASERMQKLINDLLIFSHPHEKSDVFVEVNLNNLIKDVLSDIELEIERTGAVIRVGQLPKLIAIPSQMHQLFQNLISNGIKFNRSGLQPNVTIYSEIVSAPPLNNSGLLHRIIVEDNGIGFDEKYAEDIFIVFKRLHSYHEFEGSGVGLSICKKIIDRHNGKISVTSKPNEGTKFIIDFPAQSNFEKIQEVTYDKMTLKE